MNHDVRIDSAAQAFEAFLKQAHDDFQQFALELRFNKRHVLHQTAVALYGSVLELIDGCQLLIERKLLTPVPVLIRSALEAYVDLHNLCLDPAYGHGLELAYLQEWRKLIDETRSSDNEYLEGLAQSPDLRSQAAALDARRTELQGKGARVLHVREKFESAGMLKEYKSVYNQLCCDSHNNIRALVDRHIEFSGDDFNLVFYKAYSSAEGLNYSSMAAELLVRATQTIHTKLESPLAEKLLQYRVRLDELRSGA